MSPRLINNSHLQISPVSFPEAFNLKKAVALGLFPVNQTMLSCYILQ